ncbi:MAG: hypothetical protein ACREUQ_14765 [Burkholderiales bacterium]
MSASASAVATPLPSASPSAAATPLDPFLKSCLERVGDLDQLAWWMMLGALLLAFSAGILALYAAYKAATRKPDATEGVKAIKPDVLEPLAKFLETLSKLPVWFFLFLAGLALAWFASSISDGNCGNPSAGAGAEDAAKPDADKPAGAPAKGDAAAKPAPSPPG